MYNFCFFQHYILTENSFNQIRLKETKVVLSTDNTTKPHVEMPYVPLLFAAILLIIIGKITALIVPLNVRKFPQNRKVISNRFQQVPCRTCQFFNGNHYLNCAVGPTIALTKQALNCSDYLPKSSINGVKSTAQKRER